MKKSLFSGLFILLSGILLMAGPSFIFKTCPVSEKIMKCHWSGKAEIAVGLIISICSILILIFRKDKNAQKALHMLTLASAVSAILIPSVLIGGCKSADMACRQIAFPSIYLISSLIIIVSLYMIISLFKNKEDSPNV